MIAVSLAHAPPNLTRGELRNSLWTSARSVDASGSVPSAIAVSRDYPTDAWALQPLRPAVRLWGGNSGYSAPRMNLAAPW